MFLRHVFIAAALVASFTAHAGLFDDDEARKAILDLRQQITGVNTAQLKATEEISQLRRNMLELQNQIEKQKNELAQLRGENEQLTRAVSDVARAVSEAQKREKDLIQTTEQRISKIEPLKVTVDGQEFVAEPNEKRDYDAAFALFRTGDFVKSQKLLVDFIQRFPKSGYSPSALFWLGNAQYSTRDYKAAMINFRSLVTQSPDHLRAPEALLSIANCQLEIKDTRGAKKTLDDLMKAYPKSEAALAGKERLSQLK
ncbi:MAG: tol-pal system protein YbgF [Burkholderiaceae bacterium]|nr:tol-pal system protein YbgF [Burkholderiaceae bacterium]